jgi:hypothetical protein
MYNINKGEVGLIMHAKWREGGETLHAKTGQPTTPYRPALAIASTPAAAIVDPTGHRQ